MKFNLQFKQCSENFHLGFEEVILVDDGGYDRGYGEGYTEGEKVGYAKGYEKGVDDTTPTGEVEITENGTHDIAEYASAKVNVVDNSLFDDLVACRTTELVFPSSTKKIGSAAFYYNRFLTSVTIPNTVTSIGDHAFSECDKLIFAEVDTTSLLSYTFASCDKLASVKFGNNVSSIGVRVCENCIALISVEHSATKLESFAFRNCRKLTDIQLNTVTSIGQNTFYDCTALTDIVFSENLRFMDMYAFRNCSGIKTVTFKGTPTGRIENSVFNSCTALTDIYVPWAEGAVANAPWGATNATIHYNSEV